MDRRAGRFHDLDQARLVQADPQVLHDLEQRPLFGGQSERLAGQLLHVRGEREVLGSQVRLEDRSEVTEETLDLQERVARRGQHRDVREREAASLDAGRATFERRRDEVVGGVLEVPDLARLELIEVDLEGLPDRRKDRFQEFVGDVQRDEQVVLCDRTVEPGLEQQRFAPEPLDLDVPRLLCRDLLAVLRRGEIGIEGKGPVEGGDRIGGTPGRDKG